MADERCTCRQRILFFHLLNRLLYAETEPAEMKLSAVEKNTILKVIEKHNGNITKAAKELGLTRTLIQEIE